MNDIDVDTLDELIAQGKADVNQLSRVRITCTSHDGASRKVIHVETEAPDFKTASTDGLRRLTRQDFIDAGAPGYWDDCTKLDVDVLQHERLKTV